jgi:hypothetical protein
MVVLNLKDKRNKMNPAYVPDEMEVSFRGLMERLMMVTWSA